MIDIEYMLWDIESRCIIEGTNHIYVTEDTTLEQVLAMMSEYGFYPIKISNLHKLRGE